MNLDFGVLWIEDSYSPDEETALKRRILDAGFVARIEVIRDSGKVRELAQTHKLYHRYDIILLDFKLGDEKGNDLAPAIRELFPSVTILFYSGSADDAELRSMIARKEVEGVYCSHRDRFIERTGTLIEQTAHALNRLSGMRGLAMKVVAECDDIMRSAMIAMCNLDTECLGNINKLDEDVFAHFDQQRVRYTAALTGDLSERFETKSVDSSKTFSHFRRLTQIAAKNHSVFGLTSEQVDRLRSLRRLTKDYTDLILKKRNLLGHVIEREGATGWVLVGSDEIRVDDFPDIRRAFATHLDAFREMSVLLSAALEQQA